MRGWGVAFGWLHFRTTSAGSGVGVAQAGGGEGFSVVHRVIFQMDPGGMVRNADSCPQAFA